MRNVAEERTSVGVNLTRWQAGWLLGYKRPILDVADTFLVVADTILDAGDIKQRPTMGGMLSICRLISRRRNIHLRRN